jgi:predicted regulator of Ras-like GTPase activity (Roadblock/LC7/MglB family)
MNKIQDVVTELRGVPGIKGAAVVTLDGLVAAAALDAGTGADVVAGLASYLLMTTNKSLEEGGMGACSRLSLTATHGKAVFVDLAQSYLVVLFDQFADLAATRKDVDEAAARIRRTMRI